jgi:hypothetical protein
MRPFCRPCDTGEPGRTGSAVEFFPGAISGLDLARLGPSWRPQARSLATAPCGGRASRAGLLPPEISTGSGDTQGQVIAQARLSGSILDLPTSLEQKCNIGARFGLSDPCARRSTVTPLVMTQASARLPQSCGG